ARVRLHHGGGDRLRFVDDAVRGALERAAADHRAARPVGAAPEADLRGVALHVADFFERHAEPFMHALRKDGRVPLPVRVRAAEDGDGSARIEADVHAIIEDAAELYVVADRAAAQLAVLLRLLLALRVTLPVRHLDALVEQPRELTRVIGV